jgi:hypothetical protein
MPIEIRWDDVGQTVLRFDYTTPWTWEDLRGAVQEASRMSADLGYIVSVINDVSHASALPDGALVTFRGIARLTPDNTGLIVIAGGGMLVDTMITMFRRLSGAQGANWRTAKSLDEARAMIQVWREQSRP